MPTKKLTADQKEEIGNLYQTKKMNQKQLAAGYDVSARTINRVLQELGLSNTLPRMSSKGAAAHLAMEYWKLRPVLLARIMGLLEEAKLLRLTAYGNEIDEDAFAACVHSRAPGGVAIDQFGRAYGNVSDEQIVVVLEEALADVRKRSGLTNTEPKDELYPKEQGITDRPWRVSEHYDIFGTKRELKLSIGAEQIKQHAADRNFIRWVAGSNLTSKVVTKEQVTEFAMNLSEDEFAPLLSKIVTARVAKASNVQVQTAMLNLQKSVERNANESTEQQRSK